MSIGIGFDQHGTGITGERIETEAGGATQPARRQPGAPRVGKQLPRAIRWEPGGAFAAANGSTEHLGLYYSSRLAFRQPIY